MVDPGPPAECHIARRPAGDAPLAVERVDDPIEMRLDVQLEHDPRHDARTLRDRELPAGEIAADSAVTRPAVSHHPRPGSSGSSSSSTASASAP